MLHVAKGHQNAGVSTRVRRRSDEQVVKLAGARTCASEVKKRGSDTGDTNTARLAPYRSYAQGVQCFRRGGRLPDATWHRSGRTRIKYRIATMLAGIVFLLVTADSDGSFQRPAVPTVVIAMYNSLRTQSKLGQTQKFVLLGGDTEHFLARRIDGRRSVASRFQLTDEKKSMRRISVHRTYVTLLPANLVHRLQVPPYKTFLTLRILTSSWRELPALKAVDDKVRTLEMNLREKSLPPRIAVVEWRGGGEHPEKIHRPTAKSGEHVPPGNREHVSPWCARSALPLRSSRLQFALGQMFSIAIDVSPAGSSCGVCFAGFRETEQQAGKHYRSSQAREKSVHMRIACPRGEPGSIPGRVTGFSHVGIMPDDVVGRRIFSGISRFSRPFIPALLHIHSNRHHRLSRPRYNRNILFLTHKTANAGFGNAEGSENSIGINKLSPNIYLAMFRSAIPVRQGWGKTAASSKERNGARGGLKGPHKHTLTDTQHVKVEACVFHSRCDEHVEISEFWSPVIMGTYTYVITQASYDLYKLFTLGSPLVDDRPIINAVRYRIVSGVAWTNRTMVSSNTDTNRTGVLAVVKIGDSLLICLKCQFMCADLDVLKTQECYCAMEINPSRATQINWH
ncbi:hypothetical protein PR048_032405 [Dryococelus australis]|uniref:Uncharacterized protein n=1 Tax=Dryococelus australis TaxID=614101 RepID=A0ABQ9G4Y3_9NEOP|nr:hypothetical protein PR048_032405 [Dryococelus australis]